METIFSDFESFKNIYKPQRLISQFYNLNELSFEDSSNSNWISQKNNVFEFKRQGYKLTVFDTAAYILKKKGAMTTMKLQKLLYYSQAWSLVWEDVPLFEEKIEAWTNGPVIRELFYFHRGQFEISNITVGNSDLLDEKQRDTVDSVIDFYGDRTTQWLIELTHTEDPWKSARAGIPISERSSNEITLSSLYEYYSKL